MFRVVKLHLKLDKCIPGTISVSFEILKILEGRYMNITFHVKIIFYFGYLTALHYLIADKYTKKDKVQKSFAKLHKVFVNHINPILSATLLI